MLLNVVISLLKILPSPSQTEERTEHALKLRQHLQLCSNKRHFLTLQTWLFFSLVHHGYKEHY